MTPTPIADDHVVRHDEIDSTNDDAERRVARGDTGPLWIVARKQTRGRGRLGRRWTSPEGNLYASLLIPSPHPPREAALAAAVAAVAVRDAAKRLLPDPRLDIALKWPNDVLIDGRKVGGILIENHPPERMPLPAARRAPFGALAIGCGINVLAAPDNDSDSDSDSAADADALARHDDSLEVDDVFAALRAAMRFRLAQWRDEGFAPLRRDWNAAAHRLGGSISAGRGDTLVRGENLGLDGDGALRLRLADGSVRRVISGEVDSRGEAA